MPWFNNDGLSVKFGREEAVVAKSGQYSTDGPWNVTELQIELSTLPTNSSAPFGSLLGPTGVMYPEGSRLDHIEIFVETAAVAAGTLSMGLLKRDRSTNLHSTGFLAAVAGATLSPSGANLSIYAGGTGAGNLLGLASNLEAGWITAYNASGVPFTAGKVVVRIFWYPAT